MIRVTLRRLRRDREAGSKKGGAADRHRRTWALLGALVAGLALAMLPIHYAAAQ